MSIPYGDRVSIVRCSAAANPLNARIRVPGSKSITNRALAIAAWANGTSLLENALFAEDTLLMVNALRTLGIRVTLDEPGRAMEVTGCRGHLPENEADIFCGNSGTTIRFLTAMTALGHGLFRFDGVPRLRERPIGPLVDALRAWGAGAHYGLQDGFPPLVIHAAGLEGGHLNMDSPTSSQMVTALLLAAPYAASDAFLEIRGGLPSAPYVRMTTALMDHFGVVVLAEASTDNAEWRFVVPASQRYQAKTLRVEPDATAASYFLAAAAVVGGRITVDHLGMESIQGDAAFVQLLEKMGCQVDQTADATTVSRDSSIRLRGVDVDLNAMPDVVPTLAVAALFAEGPTTIRNVANLRLKESDRITALTQELRKLGATMEERPDGLVVHPPARFMPAELDAHGDHRLAMSFALAALRGAGVSIRGADCCAKTYPGFFSDWFTHVAPRPCGTDF